MAMVLDEPEADRIRPRIASEKVRIISAINFAEALIVSARRELGEAMAETIEHLGLEVVSTTPQRARDAADAYARWGKGVHQAKLNLADCFAYALAQERRSPLLYVGRDFAQTDVASAIPRDDL